MAAEVDDVDVFPFRKLSDQSLDLGPVLFEERCNIVHFRSPTSADIPDVSFISPTSSSSSSSAKRKAGRPRTYTDGYRSVQNTFTRQMKIRLDVFSKWQTIKNQWSEENDIGSDNTHSDFAAVLLKCFEENSSTSSPKHSHQQ